MQEFRFAVYISERINSRKVECVRGPWKRRQQRLFLTSSDGVEFELGTGATRLRLDTALHRPATKDTT